MVLYCNSFVILSFYLPGMVVLLKKLKKYSIDY